MEKTVYVYTGDPSWLRESSKERHDIHAWAVETLTGVITSMQSGVQVRKVTDEGTSIWQVPWTSVKYITWREDK